VVLWMSLVDVAVGDLVTCMSTKMYTLRECKCTLLAGVVLCFCNYVTGHD